jgi:hypothetical protein
MNKNSRNRRPAINKANIGAKRKSADKHPKVGNPNKAEGLRGPSIREQLVMLGHIREN